MCLAISTIPIGIIGGIEGFQSSFLLIGLIFLVTFFASITISYLITRPLEKLTGNINEISKGQLDVTLPSSEIHEINNLTDLINELQHEKADQIEKRKLEEIARLQRQQEYEDFQKEIRKRQEMFEQQKQEQQNQYQGLIEQRKNQMLDLMLSGQASDPSVQNQIQALGKEIDKIRI